jgi:hypothetical protein
MDGDGKAALEFLRKVIARKVRHCQDDSQRPPSDGAAQRPAEWRPNTS